jgi:hypothetical protein
MNSIGKLTVLFLMLILVFSCQKEESNDLYYSEIHSRVNLKSQIVPVVPKYGLKSTKETSPGFLFYLVAEVDAPIVDGINVQATHVEIEGNLAFVSYNVAGPVQKGAVDVIDITNPRLPLIKASFEFPDWDINSVGYYNRNILLVGQNDSDGAFFAAYNFEGDELHYSAINSFSANSMKIVDDKILITSGDINGGLTILDANDFSELSFILAEDARSVAGLGSDEAYILKAGGIGLFSDGDLLDIIEIDENYLQEASKAELDISEEYIFAALNRGGSVIWNRSTLSEVTRFSIPDYLAETDPEIYVSNSVSFNNPLLFNANGGSGIMVSGKVLNPAGEENFLEYGYFNFNEKGGSTSSNFVKSEGNVIFVASGLGGLKILTIEEYLGLCKWTEETAYSGTLTDDGDAWWYYFDVSVEGPQPVFAGQKQVEGAYVYYDNGMMVINPGVQMRLKNVDEPVKVQGFNLMVATRPASGKFQTYRGNELEFEVPHYPYYVIHLDVEVRYIDFKSR